MKQNKTEQDKFKLLRFQAEELLRAKDLAKTSIAFEDLLKLIHELET